MVHTKCSTILVSLLKTIASVKKLVIKFTKIRSTLRADEVLETNNYLMQSEKKINFSSCILNL